VLTGPQRKFCEGVVSGLNATRAYCAAYPESSEEAARRSASDLLTKPDIRGEIAELREKAEGMAGSAVLTLAEKRKWLARLLRANVTTLLTDVDGDLLAGMDAEQKRGEGNENIEIVKLRICDKIAAIKLDNDLAGEGEEAKANDALTALLGRIRK
jgi:phage terminase small subunit